MRIKNNPIYFAPKGVERTTGKLLTTVMQVRGILGQRRTKTKGFIPTGTRRHGRWLATG